MAGYDRSGLGPALKEVYEDDIVDLTYGDDYLLRETEKADPKEFPGGDVLSWLVTVGSNTSYAVNNMDGGVLPDAGRATRVKAKVDVADHDGSCGVTQDAIDRAKQGEAAFFNVVTQAKDELVSNLRRTISPQLYMEPVAVWPVAANATASTTVELGSVQYLRVGQVLRFGNRTTGSAIGDRQVTAYNPTTNEVTLDSAITVTSATDGAWFPGAGPADTRKIESLALAASSSRTLHTINSATYPTWNGNTINVGGVADEGDVSDLAGQLWERGADGELVCLTTIGIQRRIADGFVSQKRFNDAQSVNLKGGYSALMIGAADHDIPIMAKRDVPKGRLFMYEKKAFRLYNGPSGFITPPGSSDIFRYDRNTDGKALSSFTATYRMKLNLLFKRPDHVGQLAGCTDNKPIYQG